MVFFYIFPAVILGLSSRTLKHMGIMSQGSDAGQGVLSLFDVFSIILGSVEGADWSHLRLLSSSAVASSRVGRRRSMMEKNIVTTSSPFLLIRGGLMS